MGEIFNVESALERLMGPRFLGPQTLDEFESERRYLAEREAEKIAHAKKQALDRRWNALSKLSIPLTDRDESAIVDETLSDSVSRSLPAVREWSQTGKARVLALCGPPGRGKTVAAAWAAMAYPGASEYLTARKLEQLRMASFGDEAERYENALRMRGLLIVDDLGREDNAERMTSALLDVVDNRRGTGKHTILIANMSRAALEQRYPDARLWSRMGESAQFVADAGEDLRKAVKL
jgi:DNA replication protein DnaC